MQMAYKLHVHRTIQRVWTQYLSASEMKVVLFICTMTVDWGKTEDKLKVNFIREGFKGVAGTGMCDKTIRTCMKSLIDREFIFGQRTKQGFILGLNMALFDEETMLAKPKKERSTEDKALLKQAKATSKPVNAPGLKPVNDTVSYIREEHTFISNIPTRGSPSAPPRSLEDVLTNTVREKNDVFREKLRQKAKTGDYWSIWSLAWKETFPEATCPKFTGKELGQVRNLFRTGETKQPSAFLEWCVTDWRLIMGARFAWMNDEAKGGTAPEYPSIGFILKFKERFYDAWNDRVRLSEELRISNTDRQRRRLMHSGLSYEEADKEVLAKSRIAEGVRKSAKTVEKLNDAFKRAEARRADREASIVKGWRPGDCETSRVFSSEHGTGFSVPGYTDTDRGGEARNISGGGGDVYKFGNRPNDGIRRHAMANNGHEVRQNRKPNTQPNIDRYKGVVRPKST